MDTGANTRIGKAFVFATAIMFLSPGLVRAAGMRLDCSRADVFNPKWKAPITFGFDGEGEGRGMLKVGGVFGAFAIPAYRQRVEVRGVTNDIIHGTAKAHVKNLPSLADVDACIDKVPGARSGAPGSDAFLDARDQCMRELPAAAAGVDVMAQIRVGIDGDSSGGEDAYVLFKLIYDAPGRTPGDEMVVEAFPSECTLKN